MRVRAFQAPLFPLARVRLAILLAFALVAGCASNGGDTATTSPETTTTGSTPQTSTGGSTTPTGTTPASTPPTSTTPASPTSPTNSSTPQLSISKRVSIGDFRFEPAELVVAAGSEVRFDNAHVVTHTATADDGLFDSGRLQPGDRYEVQINATGTYSYYCKLHPNMRGNITVIEAPEETTPTPTSPTPVEDNTTVDVRIFDYDFRPRALDIEAGQMVVWTNTATRAHTATADNGAFDSGRLDSSGTFAYTFATPGTYTYKCTIHPGLMSGTITVT